MGEIDLVNLVSHLLVFMVVLLLAISAHEAGHAWMSYKFGDDTAYMLGRVTLNPVSHTDPIGTLLIPIVAFIFGAVGGALGSIPLIGWGKPTPVNPRKWERYKLANVMVSIAGVLANLILFIIGVVLAKVLMTQGFTPNDFFRPATNPLVIFVTNMMLLNMSLFVFNLLPFPPLDGSKILATFLPESAEPILNVFEQYGFLILMFLIYIGVFSLILYPFRLALAYLLIAIY
ncbi:MAG: site-2 protease family protein [Pyrinomonadaceae bacterium]|nr:site-2 protease family protein [Blastocatellia bacterium]MDQ3219715.1 site-2 protease family protein [Acidobacteriota bacterium]MDQ3490088.1 site-2 protease family protein [Acidobacteriota bacterium]